MRRRDNHGGLDVAGHLGLPGHALHGRGADLADAEAGAEDHKSRTGRAAGQHGDVGRRGGMRGRGGPAAGSSAFLSSAANAGIAIANTTRTNNAILANLNTELISSEMVFPACSDSALVRMDCHADKKCRQKREYIGLQEGHEQLQEASARPSRQRSPS